MQDAQSKMKIKLGSSIISAYPSHAADKSDLDAAATMALWTITIWSISSSRLADAGGNAGEEEALALGDLRSRFGLVTGNRRAKLWVRGKTHVSPGKMNPGWKNPWSSRALM